jgi:hypothetical protein
MEEGKARVRVYPHNILEAFGNGCVLDLRVRFAMDLLRTSPIFEGVGSEFSPEHIAVLPKACAAFALALATELLALAEQRGLVEPLPDDDGLNRQLRLHAARTARYSVWQQLAGARVAAEEQPRVGAAPGGRVFNG